MLSLFLIINGLAFCFLTIEQGPSHNMSKHVSRKFSSAAKYLKGLMWDVGARADVSVFQTSVETAVNGNSSLAKKVTKATIEYANPDMISVV